MKNFKIRKIILIISSIIILVLSLTSCTKKSDSQTDNKNNSENSQKLEQKTNSSNSQAKGDLQEDKVKSNDTYKNSGGIEFTKEELESTAKIDFNTPWKSSEDGTYSASIEGKGEDALEEGQGKIIVKGKNKIICFQIKNNPKKSPRFVEWADNENLLVIIGSSSGTVSKGGNLYMLNINTEKVYLVLKTPSDKQQIMSVQKNDDKLNLKINVYDDDVYNKSHVEEWTLESFNTNLNKKMQVKDSNGKIILEI